MRDGSEDGPVEGVGGKRKVGYSVGGLGLEGGVRETRGMRARWASQNEEMTAQLSVAAAEDRAGTPEPDDVRPQETRIVSRVSFIECFFKRIDERLSVSTAKLKFKNTSKMMVKRRRKNRVGIHLDRKSVV